MNHQIPPKWNAEILSSSELFHSLRAYIPFMRHHKDNWPSLLDYQNLLQSHTQQLCSAGGARIQFVAQGGKPTCFEQQYEPRIYLHGEIQTRLQNWHDFFQVLIWCTFSKTKIALNKLHFQQSNERQNNKCTHNNRGPLENAVTLFDECGAVVASSNKALLDDIVTHQWKNLFWQRRIQLRNQLKCFVFGHAMYEKALSPYIGMTSPAVLVLVDDDFLLASQATQLAELDNIISAKFDSLEQIQSPKELFPFPVLGMPAWYHANRFESFYDNTHYFRPKRDND